MEVPVPIVVLVPPLRVSTAWLLLHLSDPPVASAVPAFTDETLTVDVEVAEQPLLVPVTV